MICRLCGHPIRGGYRFGSSATGWEHLAGECPTATPTDEAGSYTITVRASGTGWEWTISTETGTVATGSAPYLTLERALDIVATRVLIRDRTGY